ncbi:MAG: hypothetical protein KY461_04440 [Actinobacteria bacterium]|nr:hypothetical protein [Actinomycetota bacterium]
MTPAGDDGDRSGPDFGPSGYLPERASKRARKIVLRAPLGMQWVWAAIVAGAVVLIAGLLFLGRADDGPAPPFRAVGPLTDVGEADLRTIDGTTVLLVTVGGRPRAFDLTGLDEPPVFCPASRRLEAPERVWSLTGRGLGSPSLAEFPTLVSDGVLYVDLSEPLSGPPPSDDTERPACVA